MRPRLTACYFTGMQGDQWIRMASVLEHTAREHCPTWDVSVAKIQPKPLGRAGATLSLVHNTQKLEHWAEVVISAPDGAQLLLIDVDTMVLRSLDDVWDHAFDLAYTVRPPASAFPLNAGVVFLRVSDRVRGLVELWRQENRLMLGDYTYHRPWYRKYGGINQAAIGKLIETGAAAELGVQLATLPCPEWNCEDSSWDSFAPDITRIVHVKSSLRRSVFGTGPATLRLRPLVRIWRELERASAGGAAVRGPEGRIA